MPSTIRFSLLHLVALVAAVVVPLSAGFATYQTVQRAHDACDNRRTIVQTFDLYTDVLERAITSTAPDDDPARAKALRLFIDNLRADQHDTLAPLLKGC